MQEGYDLFIDADCVKWIKIHHPDTSLHTDSAVICDFFSNIISASPIGILENPLINTPSQLVFNQLSSITEVGQFASLMHPGILTSPLDRVPGTVTQSLNAEHVIVTLSPVAGTVTQSITTILATPTTSVSPLASYLVYPVQNTTPTAPKRFVPQARLLRLLTSDESLALLEGKENSKKMVPIVKEKRKIERAEKKKKRKEKKLYSKGKKKEPEKLRKGKTATRES